MQSRTAAMSGAALLGAALIGGCSVLPRERPTPPELPTSWDESPAPATTPAPPADPAWWRGFGDPLLDQLVQEALADGPSLKIAAARVREARALSRQTLTAYLPDFTARGSGQYTEAVDGPPLVGSVQGFFSGGGRPSLEDSQLVGSYGPQVSWEIPLFQRIEAAALGAGANIRQARADFRGTEIALAADTAESYVALRAAQNRSAALAEAAGLQSRLADILDVAAKAGFAAEADAADARRLAESLKARLPDAEIAARAARNNLSLLRGRAPGTEPAPMAAALAAPANVPALRLSGAFIAPADLVRARPDVAEAEAAALLAAADVGIARSDLLPQLSLSGGLSIADNITGTSLSERIVQIQATPVASVPIFGWGRRLSAAGVRKARFEQSLVRYEQTVNAAVGEAGEALAALAQGDSRLAAARAAETAATKTANGIAASYEAGIASLADRLRSDQQLIDARLARIEAESAQARAAITVYRAFAGAPFAPTTAAATPAAPGG
jgi:NodT family efflux transporter outer membrane factor (OMF) lipoprotein